MVSLLTRWLEHYDPIHRGWTVAGIANGVCATCGYFFPRIRGGYNLRRAVGRVPDCVAPIVGAAGAEHEGGTEQATVRTFPWVRHQASTEYLYRLTAISGGGVEDLDDQALAVVAFDAAGNWVGARPNAPGDLQMAPLSRGRFRLRWTYSEDGEQAAPARFNIYHDGGTGTVDYQNVVARVDYRPGRFHYEYLSMAFAHGTRVRWGVRAESSAGAEEMNEQVVWGWAEALGPAVNPTTIVALGDV